MFEKLLLIALGGGLGSVLRYSIEGAVDARLGPSVLGTFVVNISGALLLGVFLGLGESRLSISPLARAAIAIGVFGGYTTFSTLAFESVELAESGAIFNAFLNAFGSMTAGLIAVYAGLTLGRSV